ncbi:GAF domain-containing hybrid sensor histidine kinase/response regulator [Shimia sp. MMG029]|uniref:GAF domain-containing hybrid sensor histidine kinase/response regulator n=1 Tax=Shimia sp. MMG029 TaxID=3021978 RepID=UPI0022FE4927|nr:ATP-binding protein [Shimia sp. MMG029]MDA5555211.1 ATP-binding protein [Shimia sp. MMG029]
MNKPVNPAFNMSPADDRTLQALGLVDAESEQTFDNLSSLASRVLNVPVALVSIVQPSEDRQYFKSHFGLSAEVAEARQTPLSHSFCQYVRATNAPLAVSDAREHPILKHNSAIDDLGMIAYLGMPIHLPDGTPIGALCAADKTPRTWSPDDQRTLSQIALCVDEQIALKSAVADAQEAEASAQRAAQARETFLAHMAHEIRTPLNGIIGSVDLMTEYADTLPQDSDCSELLTSIETSSMGLLRILNDSLDLSKIDAGELTLELLPFSAHDATASVVSLFRASAEAKSIALKCDCAAKDSTALRLGDEFRYRQVLGNLVSNAIKFTEQGAVSIKLVNTPTDITLEVSDTGTGMEEAHLNRLFQPFTQATASVARTKGGTGLGLAIVKNLVDLMGGTISVLSAVGVGTTFKATLPMVQATQQQSAQISPDVLHTAFEGKTVLVADDSSVNRLVLSKMLENMGATVKTASNGAQTLQQAHDTRFDMLFIDIQMPDFSGDQIARALRCNGSTSLSKRETKLVAVTANVFPDQVQSYLDAGFDHCLGKPLKRVDLLEVLQSCAAGCT